MLITNNRCVWRNRRINDAKLGAAATRSPHEARLHSARVTAANALVLPLAELVPHVLIPLLDVPGEENAFARARLRVVCRAHRELDEQWRMPDLWRKQYVDYARGEAACTIFACLAYLGWPRSPLEEARDCRCPTGEHPYFNVLVFQISEPPPPAVCDRRVEGVELRLNMCPYGEPENVDIVVRRCLTTTHVVGHTFLNEDELELPRLRDFLRLVAPFPTLSLEEANAYLSRTLALTILDEPYEVWSHSSDDESDSFSRYDSQAESMDSLDVDDD